MTKKDLRVCLKCPDNHLNNCDCMLPYMQINKEENIFMKFITCFQLIYLKCKKEIYK